MNRILRPIKYLNDQLEQKQVIISAYIKRYNLILKHSRKLAERNRELNRRNKELQAKLVMYERKGA